MSNEIIFQEDYEGYDVIIYLHNDTVKLFDEYNQHHAQFKIEDVDKYIELCRELQDYQEYDEEEDEFYDPDEIYTNDHDDGFLLYGDWVRPWRLEYYIDAIEKAKISNVYNIDDMVKLNKEELRNKIKDYNTSMLGYILKSIKEQKELQQA